MFRGERTATRFARELGDLLRHKVARAQITRWENGTHVPGADVFLAAMALSHAEPTDLPSPIGQDARRAEAITVATRLDLVELEVARLRDFHEKLRAVVRD